MYQQEKKILRMLLISNVAPEMGASVWSITETNDIIDSNEDTYVVDELIQKIFSDWNFSLPDALTLYNHINEKDIENRSQRAMEKLLESKMTNQESLIMAVNFIKSIDNKNPYLLKFWFLPKAQIRTLKELSIILLKKSTHWFSLYDADKELMNIKNKKETQKQLQELDFSKKVSAN